MYCNAERDSSLKPDALGLQSVEWRVVLIINTANCQVVSAVGLRAVIADSSQDGIISANNMLF